MRLQKPIAIKAGATGAPGLLAGARTPSAGKCGCGGDIGATGACVQCASRHGAAKRGGEPRFSARELPNAVHEALRSPGAPLDPATRAAMETRFGHSFADVRVHTGGKADESARAIDAAAYTAGNSVVFGAGRYAPHTSEGNKLLAHELAHVLQQSAARAGAPAALDESGEAEAERAARGGPAPAPQRAPAPARAALVQRRSIWEGIAGLFAGEDFPEPELLAYLERLDRTGEIEDYTESDNKARAIVRRWKRGDAKFLLTPARKILLIREMLSGFTGDDDEQAILELLRGSTDAEFDQILAAIGKSELDSNFQGAEQDQLDALVAARRRRPAPTDAERRRATRETQRPETVLELQRRFTSNAESTNRLNCILIVRDVAPRLFAADPELAERVRARLARLHGRHLTMPDLGRAMADLGLASAYRAIRFDHGNGREQPTKMEESAWDAIIDMVGGVQGWHIFGVAVFDGYHSVTVLVDNRPDGPRVYWADQWRIDPGDDFHQEEGSVSGFRRYERAGFDQFINERTAAWWKKVFDEKHKRYDATLHIWKFRSALSEGPTP